MDLRIGTYRYTDVRNLLCNIVSLIDLNSFRDRFLPFCMANEISKKIANTKKTLNFEQNFIVMTILRNFKGKNNECRSVKGMCAYILPASLSTKTQ
jgi:hypothetical protein